MIQKIEDPLDKILVISKLLDVYGPLLTDKQREFVKLHYNEDLSFGEIGKMFKISRQAVHDAVRHALNSMDQYEEKLHLVEKSEAQNEENNTPEPTPVPTVSPENTEILQQTAQQIESILTTVKKQGVIYNTRPLQGNLKSVLEQLKKEIK